MLRIVCLLVLCISLCYGFEYERLSGFHLHNGQELDAELVPRDGDINVSWNIYQFITVTFSGFDNDETVKLHMQSEQYDHIFVEFKEIPSTDEKYEIPIAGIIPGTYTLTITGEQSGDVAFMGKIDVALPRAPIKFF